MVDGASPLSVMSPLGKRFSLVIYSKCFVLLDRVSQRSPGSPGTPSVDPLCLCLPGAGITGMHLPPGGPGLYDVEQAMGSHQ